MRAEPRVIDCCPGTFDSTPCCGIRNPAHPGRCEKLSWLKANLEAGLRAKSLLSAEGRPFGYIEYVPGEYAWRGIEASGYMVIHCLWVHSKQHQGKGYGGLLLESCLEDAEQAGLNGVAVVARDGPWLAGPSIFLRSGFEPVSAAPPDYQLLVRKFRASVADPVFKGGWDEKAAKYRRGLTIIRSSQCPYIAKFSAEIAESAEKDYGIRPRIVTLKSCRDAQDAPTPYAVFALILDGRVIADHQVSRTRFRNIMRQLSIRTRA